jgi:hypothetical protein
MGVAARPDLCDDVLRGSVVERFAIGLGGAVRKRPKRRFHSIFAAAFEGRERVLEELCCTGVGGEGGDGPHDMRTPAERGPIETEGAQERPILFERGLRRGFELEPIRKDQVLTRERPAARGFTKRVVADTM